MGQKRLGGPYWDEDGNYHPSTVAEPKSATVKAQERHKSLSDEIEENAGNFASVYSKDIRHFVEETYLRAAADLQAVFLRKAVAWWKDEMRSSMPDDIYEYWVQHKLEEFERAMKGE